jgi:hypothetical protein
MKTRAEHAQGQHPQLELSHFRPLGNPALKLHLNNDLFENRVYNTIKKIVELNTIDYNRDSKVYDSLSFFQKLRYEPPAGGAPNLVTLNELLVNFGKKIHPRVMATLLSLEKAGKIDYLDEADFCYPPHIRFRQT